MFPNWRKRLSDIYNITINIGRGRRRRIKKLNLRFSQPYVTNSASPKVTLAKGESKKFDINADNKYELEVKNIDVGD